MIAACRKHGMAVVAYSPIARGQAKGDELLARIGQAHGKTAAQVCLRWLTQQGIVVIPRTSKIERLEENFAILDFELSDAEMKEIAGLARTRRPHRRLDLVAEVGLNSCTPHRRRCPACPGHPAFRAMPCKQGVDGRDKPGHDS